MNFHKIIVTTTINKPSRAILKFAAMPDWGMIIVGDKKTPHRDYFDLESRFFGKVKYLEPNMQDSLYPDLSKALGWNTIQRRNIGFIEAYKLGAEIFATIDDDNEPYSDWGKNLLIGKKVEVDFYHTDNVCFDPVSVTNYSDLWHRGYPIEDLSVRLSNKYKGVKEITPLIQSDFEDGDPDIDAMCRIINNKPIVKWRIDKPFSSNAIAPFNSQNTFFHRKCAKYYSMVHIKGGLDTRMDDIWGSYLLQLFLKDLMPFVVFSRPSVYQDRNDHNFILDLEREIIGYHKTKELLTSTNYKSVIPKESSDCIDIYMSYFD